MTRNQQKLIAGMEKFGEFMSEEQRNLMAGIIAAGSLKRGTIFEHRHWLDPQSNKPLRCKVTRVAMDTIYYRPHYGFHDDGSEWLGGVACFPISQTARYVAA